MLCRAEPCGTPTRVGKDGLRSAWSQKPVSEYISRPRGTPSASQKTAAHKNPREDLVSVCEARLPTRRSLADTEPWLALQTGQACQASLWVGLPLTYTDRPAPWALSLGAGCRERASQTKGTAEATSSPSSYTNLSQQPLAELP